MSPSVCEVSSFLSEYCVILFGSGATTIRMDKNVRRIADALGMHVEYSILPRHINLAVGSKEDPSDVVTTVVAIREMPISFSKIASLSRLSWQIHDGEEDFDSAYRCLCHIANTRPTDIPHLMILVSLANASFCRLFNGDLVAMLLVFIATMAGILLKIILVKRHVDFRVTVTLCAFVSALIAAGDFYFSLGTTPQIALGSSVLYLVPGIPFINSFCDFIDRHYLCAIARLVNAVVIVCCLTLGMGLAMLLLNLKMF